MNWGFYTCNLPISGPKQQLRWCLRLNVKDFMCHLEKLFQCFLSFQIYNPRLICLCKQEGNSTTPFCIKTRLDWSLYLMMCIQLTLTKLKPHASSLLFGVVANLDFKTVQDEWQPISRQSQMKITPSLTNYNLHQDLCLIPTHIHLAS